MALYTLTDIGNAYASQPSRGEPSDALRILYHARRHGGKITTEEVRGFIVEDKFQAQRILNKLVNEVKALQQIA